MCKRYFPIKSEMFNHMVQKDLTMIRGPDHNWKKGVMDISKQRSLEFSQFKYSYLPIMLVPFLEHF